MINGWTVHSSVLIKGTLVIASPFLGFKPTTFYYKKLFKIFIYSYIYIVFISITYNWLTSREYKKKKIIKKLLPIMLYRLFNFDFLKLFFFNFFLVILIKGTIVDSSCITFSEIRTHNLSVIGKHLSRQVI